jgi:DNA-binding response OmpR family regulator
MMCEIDVLIVEDDSSMRELIAMALEDAGFRVRESTAQGARSIRQAKTDAVVVALNSPKAALDDIVESLRERYPSAALVAISGYFPANTQARGALATELGVDRTLPKPFRSEQLVAVVSELTRAR